jgi:expansin (peptidoglycan-binding protein)
VSTSPLALSPPAEVSPLCRVATTASCAASDMLRSCAGWCELHSAAACACGSSYWKGKHNVTYILKHLHKESKGPDPRHQ